MIELKGTREEIAAAVKAIAPDWPTDLIKSLDLGEWHFILNGVDTAVWIDPGKESGSGRDWRTCENCADTECGSHINLEFPSIGCCTEWQPSRCRCGGLLSEIRYHDGCSYRHCFSCHADFYLEDREYYLEEK